MSKKKNSVRLSYEKFAKFLHEHEGQVWVMGERADARFVMFHSEFDHNTYYQVTFLEPEQKIRLSAWQAVCKDCFADHTRIFHALAMGNLQCREQSIHFDWINHMTGVSVIAPNNFQDPTELLWELERRQEDFRIGFEILGYQLFSEQGMQAYGTWEEHMLKKSVLQGPGCQEICNAPLFC